MMRIFASDNRVLGSTQSCAPDSLQGDIAARLKTGSRRTPFVSGQIFRAQSALDTGLRQPCCARQSPCFVISQRAMRQLGFGDQFTSVSPSAALTQEPRCRVVVYHCVDEYRLLGHPGSPISKGDHGAPRGSGHKVSRTPLQPVAAKTEPFVLTACHANFRRELDPERRSRRD